MNNYFRITGYNPEKDFSFIMDCNGMFDKMWKFSSYIIQKGLKILEISKDEQLLDVNINRVEYVTEHIFLRASAMAKPKNITYTIDNVTYNAIEVAGQIYIPDNTKTI